MYLGKHHNMNVTLAIDMHCPQSLCCCASWRFLGRSQQRKHDETLSYCCTLHSFVVVGVVEFVDPEADRYLVYVVIQSPVVP